MYDLQTKMKRLKFVRWSLSTPSTSSSSSLSFQYFVVGKGLSSSGTLVKEILQKFMVDLRYIIASDAYVYESNWNDAGKDKVKFRKIVVKQVESLIGCEPRFVDNGKGEFATFTPRLVWLSKHCNYN